MDSMRVANPFLTKAVDDKPIDDIYDQEADDIGESPCMEFISQLESLDLQTLPLIIRKKKVKLSKIAMQDACTDFNTNF